MNLARLFGLPERTDDPNDAASIGVTVGKITLPLDLALELVIRQQGQIFSAINGIQGNIAVNEHVQTNMGEQLSHLHDDVVQLQQNLNLAAMHPVERVDAQTEAKEHEDDKEKVH